METDSQNETTENACVRMILSGVNKRKRVAFSTVAYVAFLYESLSLRSLRARLVSLSRPRQRPRTGDEPRKIMLFWYPQARARTARLLAVRDRDQRA